MLHITPWERSALELLATGTSTNGMASRLGITASEIELRLSALFARMGAASATEAVRAAARRGLLANAFRGPDDDSSPAARGRGASPP